MTPQNRPGAPAGAAVQDSASQPRQSPQRQARAARRPRWTPHEDALVRRHYPTGGADAVLAAGINRSRGAVTGRAHILGVTAPRPNAWSEEEDQALRDHYPTGGYKAVQAAGVNRTSEAIRLRAANHGLPGPSTHAPWTTEEDGLLREHYPSGGVKATQAAGVDRTAAAIMFRAKRLNVQRARPHKPTPPERRAKRNHPHPWTPEEERLLKQHYPTGGTTAVQAAGVNRSRGAIQFRAATLGVKYVSQAKRAPKRPSATRAGLTENQAEHLHQLARLNGELLDADDAHHNTLRALARKGLAKHIGAGLYAITLAGLIEHRNQTA